MKYGIVRIIVLLMYLYNVTLHADPIISFFIRSYPELYPQEYSKELCEKLTIPGKICRKQIRSLIDEFIGSGIMVTYAGFLAVSDLQGQVLFPRKHATNKLYMAVTPRITPITITSYIVDHWEFEPGTPVSFYRLSLEKDKDTELHYWNMESTAVPENRHIPHETITIIADPKYIFIPTGITVASKSPNLLLPDIYAKKALHKISNALYILNLQHFMRSVLLQQKNESDRYQLFVS